MAVYWVDPYIDTTKGGIHGTTSTTTRDGAYATPFGLAEMFDANAITALNGTSLASGDEIRLKGQALTDFYYNIGTTGNTVDITSVDGDQLNYASTDEQHVTIYRTALAATSELSPAIIIHDPGMLGTNKFMLAHGNYIFPTYTNQIKIYGHAHNPIYGWLRAKLGIDVNDNVKVAFVDPAYTFDYNAVFSGANPDNAFNFGVAEITVTDGWLSSSTRGGFTILPIKAGGSHNTNCDWWSKENLNLPTFDMPSTFINWYHPTSYGVISLKHRQYFYGMVEGAFKLGQWGHCGNGAWNYFYINTSTANTNANENPCIEFGNFLNGYYFLGNGTGPVAVADRAVMRISNMFLGMGMYLAMSRYKFEFGNTITNQSYTGNALFYNTQPDGKISFLENAHVYQNTNGNALVKTTPNHGLIIPASVTNFESNDVHYPGPVNTTNGGPIYAGALPASGYMTDNVYANRVQVSPTNWTSTNAISMSDGPNVLTNYAFGQWNNNMGILDCGTTDYKTTNAMILLTNQAYTNVNRFSGQNLHFTGNTFDGAPLALWGRVSTSVNTSVPALLSYNNAAGDMVVMMSNKAIESMSHIKSFSVQLPDLSTATNLSFSCTIERSSSGMSAPSGRAYFIRDNISGADADVAFTVVLSGNVYTLTATATNPDSNARFMGFNILLSSGSGLSVTDTYTISAPTFTVT